MWGILEIIQDIDINERIFLNVFFSAVSNILLNVSIEFSISIWCYFNDFFFSISRVGCAFSNVPILLCWIFKILFLIILLLFNNFNHVYYFFILWYYLKFFRVLLLILVHLLTLSHGEFFLCVVDHFSWMFIFSRGCIFFFFFPSESSCLWLGRISTETFSISFCCARVVSMSFNQFYIISSGWGSSLTFIVSIFLLCPCISQDLVLMLHPRLG